MSDSSKLKKCTAIYLIHKEAVVKHGAVDIYSLSVPTSLQSVAKTWSCWRFFQLQFLSLQYNQHTAALEHTSGWSYGFSSADGCLHVFIWESFCMSFCNGSYFHFRSVCLWWQTAINGSARCRHKKPSRRISHHNIPTSLPLDRSVSLLQDTNPMFPNMLS